MAAYPAAGGSSVISVHDGLHQLKALAHQDPAFAKALRSTHSTEEAVRLAADRGIAITPETLWRQRGTLVKGGVPTWRG